MKPERWQQLDALFHAALERESAERAAFLDEACAGDESLRKQVESLLAAHEEAGSFIESPAMEFEARGVVADHGGAQAVMATGETVSHYRIVSPIGVGGMGQVFLAHDMTLGRKVALKLLPAEFTTNADRVRRFQQEARAASSLNHPKQGRGCVTVRFQVIRHGSSFKSGLPKRTQIECPRSAPALPV